jgi:predicted aminopeptidase
LHQIEELLVTRLAWKIIRRIGLALVILITVLVVAYWDLVVYGIRQASGQLNIIWNAKPVEEFLADPAFPDSLKARLHLIDEVRRFAIDSLGLKDTENYKTMYDQKGKEIMWVVIAARRYKLEPKEWEFPILGAVPYKGFFSERLAKALRDELEKEGWDVIVRNPGGWSTLGWFTDPILSKMLNRSEGDLANLIIHEMSHATIFIKDSVDFNENLATFIGDRGTEQFLIFKYGQDSKEYNDYIAEDADYLKYVDHMLRGGNMLDSLYSTMKDNDPDDEKKIRKEEAIRKIVNTMDTLSLELNTNPSERFRNVLPNNAYFINFRQYQASQDVFFDEWESVFGRDLRKYIRYLSEKHPFL